jgi:hypothetical protein
MTGAKLEQNWSTTGAIKGVAPCSTPVSLPYRERLETGANPAKPQLEQKLTGAHGRAHTRLGKWSSTGVPHTGWVCAGIEDLGEPDETCQMCETMEIRYVHTMTHPDYPEPLRCGCVCAGHMEGDMTAAREREKRARRRTSKRIRWLKRWRTSLKGNPYVNTDDGLNVAVFRQDDQQRWGARLVDRRTGYIIASSKAYVSEEAAKLAAFDAVERYRERYPDR